jgi:cell division protein ZapA
MESREKKSVRVTIYNQPYTLGVSGEPGEVEDLAHSVDALMTSIAQRAGNVDGMKVAVLACLQLADQARGMERDLNDLKARVDSTARACSGLLDDALESC